MEAFQTLFSSFLVSTSVIQKSEQRHHMAWRTESKIVIDWLSRPFLDLFCPFEAWKPMVNDLQ